MGTAAEEMGPPLITGVGAAPCGCWDLYSGPLEGLSLRHLTQGTVKCDLPFVTS